MGKRDKDETEEERAARKAAKKAKQATGDGEKGGGETEEEKAARKAAKKASKKAAGETSAASAPAAAAASSSSKPSTSGMSAADYRKKEEITTSEGTVLPDAMQTFEDTPFSAQVMAGFKTAGFGSPSPIQAQGWPVALAGSDMVSVAKTGSGKTLAFLLPAAHVFCGDGARAVKGAKGPTVLILAPTRELAMQIHVECEKFVSNSMSLFTCVLYGGVPKPPQLADLKKGPGIVVATPGRLVDLMDSKACDLSNVSCLVLDEADRMLDMGFEPQISRIVGETVQDGSRQTLFFTATWPKNVQKMAAKYLQKDPNKVSYLTVGSCEELVANKAVHQQFFELDDSEKDAKLWGLIQELGKDAKIVAFANTKRRIDYLAKACWEEGLGASAIHGDKSQADRDKALKAFTTGEWPLMFATDVAARGLDIKGVTHVINFDMPRDVENYIHRIGRTARAGSKGVAITFWNKSYDIPCAPALAKIAREAGQEVPGWLEDWAKKASRQKKDKNWNY